MRFFYFFFFFKQETAYELVSGDWSSDVCSSDPPPGADLASGSARAQHGLSVPDGGAFAARGRLAKISWTPDNLHLRNEKSASECADPAKLGGKSCVF